MGGGRIEIVDSCKTFRIMIGNEQMLSYSLVSPEADPESRLWEMIPGNTCNGEVRQGREGSQQGVRYHASHHCEKVETNLIRELWGVSEEHPLQSHPLPKG